ncbi:hypothetical protein [Candidatus Enterococcus mansonii]|uniref:Uncharacterized protein n=1 Tax=Candidatus Enterococcus mansonii TaxID=1834181 RepID=A0A242CDZ7_9ENTE|nr:hypothetical protein [Enterococcus sp. 4G2_DIV0659]OTO08002.1 hypothetical protein A5880_002272 [Enterococcus sp. 4G2_DIV0659]
MKKPLLQRKWVWIVFTLIVGFTFLIFNSERKFEAQKKEKARQELKLEKKAKKLLKNKIKVPDPYFKTQEQVSAEYKAKGLKINYVVSNFDDKATINKRFLRKGECDQLSQDNGATYYNSSEVGLKNAGYYAEKGDTIIIGYSDHDFDGTKKETPAPKKAKETEKSTLPSSTNETSESSNQKTSAKKNASPSLPDEVVDQVTELNNKYDRLIEKVKGYAATPSTYTLSEYSTFMTDYTDIITDFGELSETIQEYGGDISSWKGYDSWMKIVDKNNQLLIETDKLPAVFAD